MSHSTNGATKSTSGFGPLIPKGDMNNCAKCHSYGSLSKVISWRGVLVRPSNIEPLFLVLQTYKSLSRMIDIIKMCWVAVQTFRNNIKMLTSHWCFERGRLYKRSQPSSKSLLYFSMQDKRVKCARFHHDLIRFFKLGKFELKVFLGHTQGRNIHSPD